MISHMHYERKEDIPLPRLSRDVHFFPSTFHKRQATGDKATSFCERHIDVINALQPYSSLLISVAFKLYDLV